MLTKRNKCVMMVSNLTGIPVDDIMSTKRYEAISTARQLVMWALCDLCGYTHTQVGVMMRRDHTTITYAIAHINGGHMGRKVEELKKEIRKEVSNEEQD